MASSPSPSPGTTTATAAAIPAPATQPNTTPADPSTTPPAASPPLPAAAAPPQQPASPPPSPPPTPAIVPPPPVIVLSPPPSPPASLPPPSPPTPVPAPPTTPVAPPKPSPLQPPAAASPPPPSQSDLTPPNPPARSNTPPVVQSPPPPNRRPPRTPRSPPVAPPPSVNPLKPSPASPSPTSGDPIIPSPPVVTPSAPGPSSPSSVVVPAMATDPASPVTDGTGNAGSSRSSSASTQGSSLSPTDGGMSSGAKAGIGVVIALLVLSLAGAAFWYKKKRRRATGYHAGFVMPSPASSPPVLGYSAKINCSAGSPDFKESMSEFSMGNCRFFSFEELHQITNGFSAQNLLGEGGFGPVYKGLLADGREVAVKKLKDGGGQGEREFHAEVEIISRVHHRHLVSLVGYCISEDQRLLAYDFVPNDTLHYHLHGRGMPVLEWSARVKIAAGSARGIAYLHEDCHPRIIHRDIKSSNILLDNNFEALVADFGLARLAMDAVTHVTTRVMGTFGYLAPEYASSGKVTERSDVFSFGVVLLELVTGRKPVDASKPMGDESLVEWARPLLAQAVETGNVGELVDPRLDKNFNEAEMFHMIEAAAACIRHSASRRPRMSQVVRVLDSLADMDLTNGVQPGKSEMFSVANTAEIRLFQRMAFGSQDFTTDFSQSSWDSRSRYVDASGLRSL
ncbi:hypothetical protein GUJ93_ZPchr0008g11498 [Zizania palustris]|uniref:non-specific serine/threonine protein kinase n=1 Tax=Zizania palustris TaxID=103762 RepID=A0A8J5RHX2_ZIZPA|nr:hypothetical protein GUJ93_ZPchr0008g11498 [Zizania palustris]